MLTHTGRFPEDGWISTPLHELADIIELSGVSASQIQAAADVLAETIKKAGSYIEDTGQAIVIAELLRQHHDPDTTTAQASRMAAMLIINAFVFQDILSMQKGSARYNIRPVQALRIDLAIGPNGRENLLPTVEAVCLQWAKILKTNWQPIFGIAKRIVETLPPLEAPLILDETIRGAQRMLSANLGSVQDMAGQMFGKMVIDRDLLKAHYTRPEAAALLSELAVRQLDRLWSWNDQNTVAAIRVADFACGTGMLLSSTYRRIASRVRRHGLDDAAIHRRMIEKCLIGLDVLPSAAHLTAMAVSAAHPDQIYTKSNIHLVPFRVETNAKGKQIAKIGSLELLDTDVKGTPSLFGRQSDQQVAGTSDGADGGDYLAVVESGSCDLVIMNSPYGRATKHSRTSATHAGRTIELIPPFAAFGASPEDQRTMSNRLNKIIERSRGAAHGNAGMGSYFFDLAHAKVKSGGVVALVLPLTSATGKDWSKFRGLLASHYDDIVFVGLAGATDDERQFSADTGIAETLVIATRRHQARDTDDEPAKVRWVSLDTRPPSEPEAVITARSISENRCKTTFTSLRLGSTEIGRIVEAGIENGGLLAIKSQTVAETYSGIVVGELRLQRFAPASLPIIPLNELGERGPYHLDIATSRDSQGSKVDRAPFFIDQPGPPGSDPFPMLWAHDAVSGRESSIETYPDRAGSVREGQNDSARQLFKNWAVRLHINQDFDLGSQMLAAAVTPKRALGGRAWPGFKPRNPAHTEFLALWMNTTLGLFIFWSTSSRQQKRRSIHTVTSFPLLPVYDPRSLSAPQIKKAAALFEKTKTWQLLPANQANIDENRMRLDRSVLCELLGLPLLCKSTDEEFLDALAVLRTAWCAEPHITRRY
ncbi:MAG: hypothetical protein F4X48_08265 [Acidimicrobiia bacterium]|nr:hypothetical protein [Acidimicrobiia bacterium]MYC58552.1 hypothetical protein [Acidimicrobiia bacterium]MYI30341.1 hypothetical protein [Acidimicrobiia bacterium]